MQISFDDEFWSFYQKLTPQVQRQADKAFERFVLNSLYPSLQFKPVKQQYAIRINRGYRALGYMQDDTMVWDWIGPHDEYERRVRNR